MAQIERGRVQGGAIVFAQPLGLPEGTEVVVRIETLGEEAKTVQGPGAEDFASLPFFGMWADREEMADSAAWVRQGRKRWQQRAARRD